MAACRHMGRRQGRVDDPIHRGGEVWGWMGTGLRAQTGSSCPLTRADASAQCGRALPCYQATIKHEARRTRVRHKFKADFHRLGCGLMLWLMRICPNIPITWDAGSLTADAGCSGRLRRAAGKRTLHDPAWCGTWKHAPSHPPGTGSFCHTTCRFEVIRPMASQGTHQDAENRRGQHPPTIRWSARLDTLLVRCGWLCLRAH